MDTEQRHDPSAFADFDAAALDAFLRDAIEDLNGAMRIERIAGGQSNPTYFVSYDDRELVLRKQPPGTLLASAHAVDREYRIITALAGTDVPVPRTLLFHGERDVVGTPFYVMQRVTGRVSNDNAVPGVTPQERRAMYWSMCETLAKLHRVDWKALGLGDYGKPGNYYARQIARWTKQWELSKTRELPEVERLVAWLPANIPPGDDETTINHGDFRLGNLMFHPTEPRVVAVLDWELSTLGHPLADVAYNCIAWHTEPREHRGVRGVDLEALGIPSEHEYVERYYALSGRTSRLTGFHFAFAMFRLAVILEGIAARVRAGNAVGADAAHVGEQSVLFARRALEAIEARLGF